MSKNLLYTVQDLHSAREFLRTNKNPIELTNINGSTGYYGMRTLNYIFKTLQNEFPQIIKIIVNVDNDHSAVFTAIKLGFKYINSSSSSKEIHAIINNNLNNY